MGKEKKKKTQQVRMFSLGDICPKTKAISPVETRSPQPVALSSIGKSLWENLSRTD